MPHFGNGFRANHRRNDLPNWQAKWHAVQTNWSARCGR
jgi:hypothetical protein